MDIIHMLFLLGNSIASVTGVESVPSQFFRNSIQDVSEAFNLLLYKLDHSDNSSKQPNGNSLTNFKAKADLLFSDLRSYERK